MKENMKKAVIGNLKTIRTLSNSVNDLLRTDEILYEDAIVDMANGITDIAISTREILNNSYSKEEKK